MPHSTDHPLWSKFAHELVVSGCPNVPKSYFALDTGKNVGLAKLIHYFGTCHDGALIWLRDESEDIVNFFNEVAPTLTNSFFLAVGDGDHSNPMDDLSNIRFHDE